MQAPCADGAREAGAGVRTRVVDQARAAQPRRAERDQLAGLELVSLGRLRVEAAAHRQVVGLPAARASACIACCSSAARLCSPPSTAASGS